MLRIFHNTHYDLIRWWRVATGLTAALIIIGIGSLIIHRPNWSIDFTGGTLVQVEFAQPTTETDIRSAISGAGVSNPTIQTFGSNREYTIRAADRASVQELGAGAEAVGNRIVDALRESYGEEAYTIRRNEAVGPRVGDELTRGAMLAILISFAIVLVYLAWRFEWRFGVAAIIATLHDILATVAFVQLMNLEISLTVVAALLTVLGYSLNDTIVVFDRVRENLFRKRRESLYDTLNRSINETIPRTVITSGTTLAAALALLLLAGEVLRPFAWVITFGVLVGTVSSILVASPALLWIERKWPREIGDKGGIGARVPREPRASARPSAKTTAPAARSRTP